MCTQIDIVYDITTSIEFWVSFIVERFINECLKLKTMNIVKSVLVGVGAIMWSHTQIRLVGLIRRKLIYKIIVRGFESPSPLLQIRNILSLQISRQYLRGLILEV